MLLKSGYTRPRNFPVTGSRIMLMSTLDCTSQLRRQRNTALSELALGSLCSHPAENSFRCVRPLRIVPSFESPKFGLTASDPGNVWLSAGAAVRGFERNTSVASTYGACDVP